MSIIGPDIQEAAGAFQLCAGHEAGCEAAVHAMRKIFLEDETEAILQIDATNAFNSLNRQATLHNIRRLCPPFATVLINTYREHTELFINGETILSQEGTTQGDPLTMGMYALGTLPLIHELNLYARQVWFTDDATAGGKLTQLREWWDKIVSLGPNLWLFCQFFEDMAHSEKSPSPSHHRDNYSMELE